MRTNVHASIKKSLILGSLLLLFSGGAQENAERQLGNWFGFTSAQRFSPNFSTFLQGEWRTWEFMKNTNETIFRVAMLYDFNSKNTGAFGYVRVGTNPFDRNLDPSLYENRIYEEYQIKTSWGKAKVSHRFRVEQRFVKTEGEDTEFSTRVRYMINYSRAFGDVTIEPGAFYWAVVNELMFNVTRADFDVSYDQGRLGLNQNRFSLNLGRQLTALSSLQFGLLWQHRPSGNFIRLVLAWSQNFDLRKKKSIATQ